MKKGGSMNLYIDLDDKYGIELISKALELRMGLPTPMHAYVKNSSLLKCDELQFGFGNKTSTIFKRDHPFDHDTYAKIPVKDLHEILQALQQRQVPESDIIREQWPYDGNNVVNVGKMMDRKEWLSETWSPDLKKYAVEDLENSLVKIGYNKDIKYWLERKVEDRMPAFVHKDNVELDNGVKLGCHFRFELDKQGKGYSMPEYDLKLFVNKPIEHVNINGVDTAQLEKQMHEMDWHYGIAETTSGMMKGYANAETIDAALRQLSTDEKGAQIAMQLWNNHIPPHVLSKPEFILKAEEQTSIYPKATFSAETPLSKAIEILEATVAEKHQLTNSNEKNSKQVAIHNDSSVTIVFVEKLEQRMKVADWTYDYTEDHRVWEKGFDEINGIRKDLEKLCKEPGGGAMANTLWDKYVPQYTVGKPDFIQKSMNDHSGLLPPNSITTQSAEKLKTDAPVLKAEEKKQSQSKSEQSVQNKQRNKRRLE
jgi:hypothetical protein